MNILCDSTEAARTTDLINREGIATGRELWEKITNNRAYLLVSCWAVRAGRVMPQLMEQTDSSDLADVIETLEDIQRVAAAFDAALVAVPPSRLAKSSSIRPWLMEFVDAAKYNKGLVSEEMIDWAIDAASAIVVGLATANTPWLDTDDVDGGGWIRFQVFGRPK